MSDIKLSRRDAMKIGGGALALSGLATQASAKSSATELEQVQAMVGQRFTASDGAVTASVEIEEVTQFGRRVRQPMQAPGREPFVVVFRQLDDSEIEAGTLHFSGGFGQSFDLMVTRAPGADGTHRFEAIFN